MPEFSTRWIESGPTTREDWSSKRRLVTTCLVIWSPVIAAAATAAEPGPLATVPHRESGLRLEIGASPVQVDEPTRTSGDSAL